MGQHLWDCGRKHEEEQYFYLAGSINNSRKKQKLVFLQKLILKIFIKSHKDCHKDFEKKGRF